MRKKNVIVSGGDEWLADERVIAIYARKSKATDRGSSIENQVATCRDRLRYKFGDIPDNKIKVYDKDEGISGYKTENRPDFQRMIQDIKRNEVKMVVVYKIDRVNRKTKDFLEFQELLKDFGIEFLSATQDFDTSTQTGKMLLNLLAMFAEMERDIITERISDNLMDLAKTGRWLGGSTPTGYDYERRETVRIDGKPTTVCLLTPVLDEQETVKLLFNKYMKLKSQCEVEYYTITNGIKSKNGRDYSRTAIKRILLNPVYAKADADSYEYFKSKGAEIFQDAALWDGSHGIMAYNKTDQANKKSYIDVGAIDEWIIAIGEHEGIISGKEWVETQNLIWRNSDKNFRKPLKNKAILTGLLRCEHCGNLLIAKKKNYVGDDGEYRYDYVCSMKLKSKGKKCNCKNLNGNNLDKLVMQGIKELFAPDADFAKELRRMANDSNFVESTRHSELAILEKSYKKNENDYNGLLEKLRSIPSELMNDVTQSMVTIKKENEQLAEKIRELNAQGSNVIEDKKTAQLILELSEHYLNKFDELDTLTQRDFIRLFVVSMTTDGENVNMNLVSASSSTQRVLSRNNSTIRIFITSRNCYRNCCYFFTIFCLM